MSKLRPENKTEQKYNNNHQNLEHKPNLRILNKMYMMILVSWIVAEQRTRAPPQNQVNGTWCVFGTYRVLQHRKGICQIKYAELPIVVTCGEWGDRWKSLLQYYNTEKQQPAFKQKTYSESNLSIEIDKTFCVPHRRTPLLLFTLPSNLFCPNSTESLCISCAMYWEDREIDYWARGYSQDVSFWRCEGGAKTLRTKCVKCALTDFCFLSAFLWTSRSLTCTIFCIILVVIQFRFKR